MFKPGQARNILLKAPNIVPLSHRFNALNVFSPPQLYHLGKEYPAGKEYFHTKLHQAFMKNKDVIDPKQIQQLIDRGNYVVKELEALYMLRKYRTLKKRYCS